MSSLRQCIAPQLVDGDSDSDGDNENALSLNIGAPQDIQHFGSVNFSEEDTEEFLKLEESERGSFKSKESVFGVDPETLPCSLDENGNSVPSVLLQLQKQLYGLNGLEVEGIFRVAGSPGVEERLRSALSSGRSIVHFSDVHAIASLIKAWLRELPNGILDALSPSEVVSSPSSSALLNLIPTLSPTNAALLDWAVNLMVDVVERAPLNMMGTRNIAMVFSPNLTRVTDPLLGLQHAARIRVFLQLLIQRNLKERLLMEELKGDKRGHRNSEERIQQMIRERNVALANSSELEEDVSAKEGGEYIPWNGMEKKKAILRSGSDIPVNALKAIFSPSPDLQRPTKSKDTLFKGTFWKPGRPGQEKSRHLMRPHSSTSNYIGDEGEKNIATLSLPRQNSLSMVSRQAFLAYDVKATLSEGEKALEERKGKARSTMLLQGRGSGKNGWVSASAPQSPQPQSNDEGTEVHQRGASDANLTLSSRPATPSMDPITELDRLQSKVQQRNTSPASSNSFFTTDSQIGFGRGRLQGGPLKEHILRKRATSTSRLMVKSQSANTAGLEKAQIPLNFVPGVSCFGPKGRMPNAYIHHEDSYDDAIDDAQDSMEKRGLDGLEESIARMTCVGAITISGKQAAGRRASETAAYLYEANSSQRLSKDSILVPAKRVRSKPRIPSSSTVKERTNGRPPSGGMDSSHTPSPRGRVERAQSVPKSRLQAVGTPVVHINVGEKIENEMEERRLSQASVDKNWSVLDVESIETSGMKTSVIPETKEEHVIGG